MTFSKFSTVQDIAEVHGLARAMKETWRWVVCLIYGRDFNSRFEIERQWIESLQTKVSISGVEIGVRYGQNAEFLLETLDIDLLYLVDPYDAYEEYQEDWDTGMMGEAEEIARNKLESYDSVKFIKEYSDEAMSELEGDFDFVYIDGNHEYEYVKKDLSNYYPMVKAGGILAGHDYTGSWPGVAKAVDEFAQENDLQVNTDLWGDWYINKPVGIIESS
jgi:hypothetical protein